MKRSFAIMFALLSLSACEYFKRDKEAVKEHVQKDASIAADNSERHVMRVLNNVRDQTKKTVAKMHEWWLTPLPEPQPKAVIDSYCYKVMQDIVCYRQPVQGWSHKLVGYQGPAAPTPPIAQTLPNPGSSLKKAPAGDEVEARVAKAKPVFVTPPLKVKEDTTNVTLETDVLGSEPLPNPTLSPQL